MFKFCLFTACLLSYPISLSAQNCIDKYSSLTLRGSTYDTLTSSVATLDKEVLVAGKLYDYNSAGHVARFSQKGSPIWSYQYNLNYYDFIKGIFFKAVNISEIINSRDGGCIIAGNVEQVLSPYGSPPPVKKWGLIAKLDKFGRVLWNKTFTKQAQQGDLNVTNIYETADGDFIAYMATDNGKKRTPGDHSYGKVMRLGANGQVKWSILLFTFLYDAGGLGVEDKRAILQARNNNIIIGDVVHKTNAASGRLEEGNLHFFEINYADGKLNWETGYLYPTPATDSGFSPDILNIKELNSGEFSFITTLYLPTVNGTGLAKVPVNIVSNSRGSINKIFSYATVSNTSCIMKAVAVDQNNGNRTLLLDQQGKGMLVNIQDDAGIAWQQRYAQLNMPVNCFSSGNNGYNIFLSNNRSLQYKYLISDRRGTIDCINENADFVANPVTTSLASGGVTTDLSIRFDDHYDFGYPLKRGDEYPLLKSIDCEETFACCTDLVDPVTDSTNICESKSFMLPDSTVIRDSGLYYVNFKTALGCDSIKFYKISKDKDIRKLSLSEDTCLTGSNSIILNATEGFNNYSWVNNLPTNRSSFAVSQPGIYKVSVQNACGSKSDSIEIFEQCNYPIYMPNAFTPNKDGTNDLFRIPPSNKNRLISLRVYDRWGNVVFQTTKASSGWDGSYKNQPANPGLYIFYIEMQGLSKTRLAQKGFVTLIR